MEALFQVAAMVVPRFRLVDASPAPEPRRADDGVLGALKRAVRAIEADLADQGAAIPFGIASIDGALGGGLARGAFHEIAAARETAMAAATGFAIALAARAGRPRAVLWTAEDMGLFESGAPYGPGLDDLGLAPELLVTVAAAKSRDVLWAMEEALRCRTVGAVIGEIRSSERGVDLVASRRLSLAASRRDSLALLLRTTPGAEASAASTRWIVGAAPSGPAFSGPGPPRFSVRLERNRRGPLGSWMLEWNRAEQHFDLAPADPEPVADAACHRPHRAAGA